MKSRTSFFNGTVFKKDFTRFLPVWSLYTVFLLLAAVLSLHGIDAVSAAFLMGNDSLPSMAGVNFLYAAVCAMTLFGDLYVPRMCNALHAMPLRRESWFMVHGLAGLLFSVVPNLAVVLVSLPALGQYWYVGFIWLGIVELQYLFFFGAALFAALCAGSRLGMAAVYGILNGCSMLLLGLTNLLYAPLLYGVVITEAPFLTACPLYMLTHQEYLNFHMRDEIRSGAMPLFSGVVHGS